MKLVIDLCLSKSKYCDEITNYEYLKVNWASKTNLTQRKGRAGRVKDGFCYRLIQRDFYERLDEYPQAEILRLSLDKIVLKIKKYDRYFKGTPKEVLSMAIQPPILDKIETTIIRLKMVSESSK
jgi:HrpA-like RNA helicase